ncbi:MAG: membrane protein insertase YidC [Gammaproteobacteria bacterium]|nr:membrane protein insertase YidC [Gammaproteobacteria bacterium]NNM21531.1 membrane protein insertase YidC [Gammaproteobacteria bacterium]
MDNPRLLLWISFGLICFLLWDAWMKDYGPQRQPPAAAETAADESVPAAPAESDLPSLSVTETEQGERPALSVAETVAPRGQRVRVVTDVLDLEIELAGGDLVAATLLDYPVRKDQPGNLITLLDNSGGEVYLLQSGLLSQDAAAPDHRAVYSTVQDEYRLDDAADELQVVLNWQQDGHRVEKIYEFSRGSYQVGLTHRVTAGTTAWSGAAYSQIKRQLRPPERSFFNVDSYSFTGPVLFDGEKYDKLKLKDLRKRPVDARLTGGWMASIQHHFVTAVIPPAQEQVHYRSRLQSGDVALLSAVGEVQQAAPGEATEFRHALFVGPKIQEQLKLAGPKLAKTVDYGALAIFSEPLFWLLHKIHSFVGNWGWAIILLTILIKLVFYKLTETSGRSMAKMRKLQPRLKAMQERYKDDRQKLSQAMMELYKSEGANPMSGCLPILIQMPVFLALYWVLIESVELRQAPWIGWIDDLSVRDPFFILPLLMGAAMMLQQRLNPAPPDPVQARVAQILPIVMTVFFAFFPAGLVLYWFVNTVLSVAQQWHINSVIEREG